MIIDTEPDRSLHKIIQDHLRVAALLFCSF
jgi:hypothetical protein